MMSSSCSGGKLPSLPLLYLLFLLFLLFSFYFFLLFLLLLLLIHLFCLQVGFAESAHACVSYSSSSSPFFLPSSSPVEKLNHIVSYYEILKVASVLLYTYRLGRAVFRSLGLLVVLAVSAALFSIYSSQVSSFDCVKTFVQWEELMKIKLNSETK